MLIVVLGDVSKVSYFLSDYILILYLVSFPYNQENHRSETQSDTLWKMNLWDPVFFV